MPMSLRLIEVFLPEEKAVHLEELLKKHSFLGIWRENLPSHQLLLKILLYSQEVEPVIDSLEQQFSGTDGFRLILLQVEASIPRPELLESEASEPEISLKEQNSDNTPSRINREELYLDVIESIQLSWKQILMVFLSTLIAAIGLLRGSETVLIGAMVIAPLLKPNMALAVATTLGDTALAKRTLKVGGVGILVVLSFSVLIGLIFTVSPDLPEIAWRTKVSLADVVLALASGVAGALSLTAGETSAIVGVMVAVALLPPLVTFGLLLGSEQWSAATGSMLLVITNVTCLNLAGIVTLLVQNVRPGAWWAIPKAKKLTNIAFGLWFLLLSVLVGVIFVWRRH
ncbi:TIGR00341 family protein [Lyngbya aestuarii]|uniref:TIGR00341 family protein n=1 Tax=Lyngbya aestuarii TaxID=118322 RepID=UPI00403E1586